MEENIIEVEIEDIVMANTSFAMIFYDRVSNRVLPIFIGPFEANGILFKLQEMKFPRPLTYDLIRNILDSLGSYVEKVVINDIRDNTFYANLYINFQGNIIQIDSRPSDAVAIALRFNAPIYVSQHVMDIASVHRSEYVSQAYGRSLQQKDVGNEPTTEQTQSTTRSRSTGQPRRTKKEVMLEELQRELEKAVMEERYEDAAKIRDEINKLQNKEQQD
ncbi:MAG: bifunctional nuclease family protein [Spirochaetia bacterium]|nr:bifunctional nuclease family protein [Spirochaetota bacterium]MCX8096555.1 bifunctional nuclease family protein [Spirochaetota bacterium]MDW8112138.1 bifunctional nuclease family protein [Spirochaetia bacterium]